MVLTHSASKQGRIGHQPLEARSRREIFRHICAVVFDVAARWGDRWGDAIDEDAAIVVTSPLLTRADVQSVFDEISEKYHVGGIALRFDEQDGRPLQAIFEPIDRIDPDRTLQPMLARRSLTRQAPISVSRVARGGPSRKSPIANPSPSRSEQMPVPAAPSA
jgi:hypothetical protein